MRWAIILLLFAGCGGHITPKEYAQLEKMCKNNGGTKYMYVSDDTPSQDTVYCINGATIVRVDIKKEIE